MQQAIHTLPAFLIGTSQDGAELPNTVPGIGTPAGGGAVEGQPLSGGGTGPATTQPSPFGNFLLPMMLLVVVFMIFSTMMSSRREKKRTAEMLGALKRGDRVLTAGGMIGTVHEVREDSIVLRVDDVSGAKAHFTRGAVQQVLKTAKSDSNAEAVAEAG